MGERDRDIASTWDSFAESAPDRLAIVCGGRHITWAQFAERANRLAWHIETEAKLDRGDRVAIALPNTAEYLETFYAALKLGCVPVNVDVRQSAQAIHAILDHSDAKVVVHLPEHEKAIKTAAKRIGRPWRPMLFSVGDVYERAVAGAPSSAEWRPVGGAPEDLVVLYSDAGSAPPTALVWRSDDLAIAIRNPPTRDRDDDAPTTVMCVAPLTHTLGLFGACRPLMAGATAVLVSVDPFDRPKVWDVAAREHVAELELPSDGSAAKLAETLSAEPRRWDLSRLESVTCAGRLRDATRQQLAALLPDADVRDQRARGARTVNDGLRVLDAVTDRDVEPGSSQVGVLAVGGAIPLGYYKDPAKTSIQFRMIDGARYFLGGEHAIVDAHGAIRSRAPDTELVVVDGTPVSVSAVEFALRKHPSVAACVVVGISSPPNGEQLVALVEVVDRHYLDEPEMTAWCRSQLSAQQTPRRFLFIESVASVSGAAEDRLAARTLATDLLRARDA